MTDRRTVTAEREKRPTSKGALGLARSVALGSSGLAGIALGLGTYPDIVASPGPFNWALPFIIAPVVAGGLAAGWHVVLGMAAHADEPNKKVAALAFGAALGLVGMGTSSWFLAAKIGGANAIQTHQLAYVEQLQKAEEAVAHNAAIEDELVTALGSGSSGMQSMARSEGEHGTLSGKAGYERVYTILQNAAGAFLGTQTTIGNQAVARREFLSDAARDRAEAMRAIAAKNTPAFEEAAGHAAANIGKADKIRLTSMVSGLGLGLVMDEARASIEGAIGGVRSVARDVENKRRIVSMPAYFPIDAKVAVTMYPAALAWIAACLIELLPLLMLSSLLALWRNESDDSDVDPASNLIEFEPRTSRTAPLPAAE